MLILREMQLCDDNRLYAELQSERRRLGDDIY